MTADEVSIHAYTDSGDEWEAYLAKVKNWAARKRRSDIDTIIDEVDNLRAPNQTRWFNDRCNQVIAAIVDNCRR